MKCLNYSQNKHNLKTESLGWFFLCQYKNKRFCLSSVNLGNIPALVLVVYHGQAEGQVLYQDIKGNCSNQNNECIFPTGSAKKQFCHYLILWLVRQDEGIQVINQNQVRGILEPHRAQLDSKGVNRNVVLSTIDPVYKLPHELPNDLDLGK